jgi:N-methylhydantoinase A
LHCADVADECGIRRILIPIEPGTLCARGILLSDISRDFVHTRLAHVTEEGWATITSTTDDMVAQADRWLADEGVPSERRRFRLAIDARYRGQSHDIRVFVDRVAESDRMMFIEAFHQTHRTEYGHDIRDLPIEVVNCRVQAVGLVNKGRIQRDTGEGSVASARRGKRRVYFGDNEGWVETSVYHRDALPIEACLDGPVVVDEMSATTLVMPWQHVRVDPLGNLIIEAA